MAMIILLAVLVAVGLWVVGAYNGLIALKNRVANAWKQIDVQLKRRHDLVPNLVEAVKGAMNFERETMEAVIQARTQAVAAKGELAREVIRHKAETAPKSGGRFAVWVPVVLVAAISLGTYAWLGHPELPAAPLASRDAAAEGEVTLEEAIKTIETRLAETPRMRATSAVR